MNYPNGERIKVGDTLKVWEGCIGIVVCSIGDDEFSSNFKKDDWGYLNEGILVDTDTAGLIHYKEPEDTFIEVTH